MFGFALSVVHPACFEQVFGFALSVVLLAQQMLQRVALLRSRPAVEWVEQVWLHRRGLPCQLVPLALFDAPIAFLRFVHPEVLLLEFFALGQQLLRSFPSLFAVWMAAMKLPCALPVRLAFRPFLQAFWLSVQAPRPFLQIFSQAFWLPAFLPHAFSLLAFWLFFSLAVFLTDVLPF